MLSGAKYYETETLTPDDCYNEFVMTSLRTARGISYLQIKDQFGEERAGYFKSRIQKFVVSRHVIVEQEVYMLAGEGIFIADLIISGLFK